MKTPTAALCWIAAASLPLAFMAGRHTSQPAPETATSRADFRNRSRAILRTSAGDNAATRTLALLDLLDSCRTRADFLAAIEAIESTADKSEKNRFLAALFAAWLENDPLTALAEVRRVESLRHDPQRVAESFMQWAASNPPAAASLLATALDGRQSDPSAHPPFLDGIDPPDFLLSLVSGLAQSDPQLAAKTLQQGAASPVHTAAIEVLLQDWYPADQEAVREWAAAIEQPETRRTAVQTAATKAGQSDATESGISWAMDLPDQGDRQAALLSLTEQWSQRHSADAFAWASKLTDENLKLSLMPAVIGQFTLIDPGTAADWLNQYEASPAMDASVAAYARAIRNVNPQAALGSAAAITDPELRQQVIGSIQNPAAESP
ncbi:MAG: hypothetical protein Q7R22_000740 [Verrucomicrobiota bacterium JB025]|nr:hypothetical protein [Verrucomicrobiota bacterium JB025]